MKILKSLSFCHDKWQMCLQGQAGTPAPRLAFVMRCDRSTKSLLPQEPRMANAEQKIIILYY